MIETRNCLDTEAGCSHFITTAGNVYSPRDFLITETILQYPRRTRNTAASSASRPRSILDNRVSVLTKKKYSVQSMLWYMSRRVTGSKVGGPTTCSCMRLFFLAIAFSSRALSRPYSQRSLEPTRLFAHVLEIFTTSRANYGSGPGYNLGTEDRRSL